MTKVFSMSKSNQHNGSARLGSGRGGIPPFPDCCEGFPKILETPHSTFQKLELPNFPSFRAVRFLDEVRIGFANQFISRRKQPCVFQH